MTGLLSLSIDYSEDELDALADLFGVPALGSARLRRPPASGTEEAVLRATLATATRGLVARRAMVLSGTAIRPKVELLEPHATILRAFLGSTTVIRAERRTPREVDRWVVFVRDDVAVEQRAVAGRAILRMTARPASALDDLVGGTLDLPRDDDDPPAEASPVQLAARTLDSAADDVPAEAPQRVRDLLYARRRTVAVTVATRDGQAIERTSLEWLDAGTLGVWRVERDAGGATATLTPTTGARAAAELAAAYRPARVPL
jgi:hypothetical protein